MSRAFDASRLLRIVLSCLALSLRRSWQDSFFGIDDRVKSLPYMVGPAHFQRYEVTNATLAKIECVGVLPSALLSALKTC